MTAPVIRLHLFFATETDRAVILRQGPSKVFRLILWHRDTDRFEDGQWLKHKVYVERCDLSPDGRHFLYFALNGDWSGETEGAYSAISRPPYFTALALFPEGSTWGGGGRFIDNQHYFATGGEDIFGRAGGLTRVFRRAATEDCPHGLRTSDGQCFGVDTDTAAHALAADRPAAPALSLYDTMGGRLYRRRGADLDLIRDFNDMTFEPVRAPYDWRDDAPDAPETRKPWHPLADEAKP